MYLGVRKGGVRADGKSSGRAREGSTSAIPLLTPPRTGPSFVDLVDYP